MAASGVFVDNPGEQGPEGTGVEWGPGLLVPDDEAHRELNVSISEIGLPRDVSEALIHFGVDKVRDLLAFQPDEIVRIEGVGRGSVRRIRRWLETKGLENVLAETGKTKAPEVRRAAGRPEPEVSRTDLPPVPSGLEDASIPLGEIPPRMANLFRRHGVATFAQLHGLLSGEGRYPGVGAGTRIAAIEHLPHLYAFVTNRPSEAEAPVERRRETMREALLRLRESESGPVTYERLAKEMGQTPDAALAAAETALDFVFLDPWCLLPDPQGMEQAIELGKDGALGDWMSGALHRVLNENEHEVLTRWIGLARPPERHGEIARSLARSRERIRQLRERSVQKLSGAPALTGSLASLARRTLSGTVMMTDEQFMLQFDHLHRALLGPSWTPGLARLCLRASLGMRRGNVLT